MITNINYEELLILLEHPRIVEKIQEITQNSFIDTKEQDVQRNYSLSEVKKLRLEIERLKENATADKEEILKLHSCISQLSNESNALKKENDTYNSMNEQLNFENMRIKSELSGLSVQLNIKNKQYEEQIEIIRKFDRKFHMFNQFKKLEIETLKSLKGIFKYETIENFVACGSQKENIEAYWDFIKYRVMNGNLTELRLLSDIFRYFLKLHNETSDQQVFKQQIVNLGDEFDVSLHIRTPDGKASGKIGNIYLEGYLNAVTGVIIRKSIVRVE